MLPRWWKVILVLAVAALLTIVAWNYSIQRGHLLQDNNAKLESLAQLKIRWIREWIDARHGEASFAMSSRFYTPLAAHWMDAPPVPNSSDFNAVLTGFRAGQPSYKYNDALFVSAAGKIYVRMSGQTDELQKQSLAALAQAFKTQKSTLTDLYLPKDRTYPQVDMIAPLFLSKGDTAVPAGAIIYRYDARDFLYPALQFWPTPSRSAETQLVRRDGDSVLFLTELRGQQNAAVSYRIPLSDKQSLAVRAVMGEQGAVRARDYRGVNVLSVIRPVPGTSWFLIAKEDEDAVFSNLRREFTVITLMLLIMAAAVFAAHGALWRSSLRKSEDKYQSLFELMIQGALRIGSDGNITDVNPAALRMAGLTKEEFLARSPANAEWGFIREDGTAFPINEFPSMVALKTGKPARAVAGVLNAETKKHVWMEVNAIPEFSAGSTNPGSVMVTLHDITDRRLAQIENERLASAIAQANEVVIITDKEKIVRYMNPAFERVSGFKREDAIGRPLPVTEYQNEDFYRELWRILESGKSWNGRLTNTKKDGTVYTEDATISPVFDSTGNVINYVSVTRDITDFLKLQNEKENLQGQFLQAQKMESVGRLAGGVAHDFNNMLTVISGHSQLALNTLNPDHPIHSNLQEIQKAAQRSADLTRQLLAFARKQTIAPKVLDLNGTVGGLLSMLQRLIGEDIDLAWMPGHDLWPVKMDPAQVDQILANLAVNARDAIDKNGKVTVETENFVFDEAYCKDHLGYVEGEYVMLALSDDGCGMDKSVLDHLFEPFFTTKRVGEGTGLGLATVYGIVKQNEGFINVYSEPGRGSTFKIYLPRYLGPETPGLLESKPELPKGGAETILLVEDESAVLNLTKLMLERLGYKVMAATTPNEALRIASSHLGEIHLLLVDVVMPEMTGRDLADRLAAMRPNLRKAFMSGYTANVIAHRGVLDEGVHFIQKPFSIKELALKIREALES